MNKPIIHLYTTCYNEQDIMPYFLRHYLTFVDQIVIFDNESTDDSVKIALKNKQVSVKCLKTKNKLNDNALQWIKNNAWKQSRGEADFVIACDMDEFLYHPNIKAFLSQMKKDGYSHAQPCGFNMISELWPKTEGQIYDEVKHGVRSKWFDKTLLFDPNKIKEINYEPGAHTCKPEGDLKLYQHDDLKLLHFKRLGLERLIQKSKKYAARLSEANKKMGWGSHYLKSESEQVAQFKKMLAEKKLVVN